MVQTIEVWAPIEITRIRVWRQGRRKQYRRFVEELERCLSQDYEAADCLQAAVEEDGDLHGWPANFVRWIVPAVAENLGLDLVHVEREEQFDVYAGTDPILSLSFNPAPEPATAELRENPPINPPITGLKGYLAKTEAPGIPRNSGRLYGSGGRIRTYDLRVMSPTSYRTAPPRSKAIGDSIGAGGSVNSAQGIESRE